MSQRSTPPFRADHVGSLLQPQRLLDARKQREEGVIGADALGKIEDECILEAVKMQEDLGLRGITDGEFRRTNWSSDFLTAIDGVGFGEGKVRASFHRADGTDLERNVTSLAVTGKLARPQGI
jgi:5-methyltetrahydropteroyltriglutamate--homocysteine methyltransferase